MISEATRQAVAHLFETRLIGEEQPKGITRKIACYEVLGPRR